jgi:hypothetical protein
MNALKDEYRLSFTTGGLFHNESIPLIDAFLAGSDWDCVRSELVDGDGLHVRTHGSRMRISREIIARLRELSEQDLRFFESANHQEQKSLLWVAACRRFTFIREFAIEVLRENYLTLKYSVELEEFDSFFNRKAQIYDEVDGLTELTRKKLRQNLFRIMREADLITDNHMITPPVLTPEFVELMTQSSPDDLNVFPVSRGDLERWGA